MTEYYKGQRIDELLQQINRLEQLLHKNSMGEELPEDMGFSIADAFTTLAIAKAKLTSLKGKHE